MVGALARQTGSAVAKAVLVCVLLVPLSVIAKPADWTLQGLQYLHGEGVARDVDRSIVYLCAAARHGDGAAAHELGWLYFQGADVGRDDALALSWFEVAERHGVSTPARTRQRLDGIAAREPACVASRGIDLELDDRRRAKLAVAIYDIAPAYDLDPALVLEVVRAESGFDPGARSAKGALGLMQLIPGTAKRFGVKNPFEPTQNLKGGMAYLRWLLQRFNGDLTLTLAGYNAGERAVERHGGVPPYPETQDYVRKILRRYQDALG